MTAVYVEATARETEARLLRSLRRQVADLPDDLDLVQSLAALRQGRFLGAGRKVLLVLDQFEQWLHARRSEENAELVQALRQCDGGRVQCLVLVRDDFGMAATRFMAALDIPIVQGHNFATVDLFDPLHARKVLAAFGQAHGRLPDNLARCSKDENAFLDRAIAGLAQDGKVISVRLALFAEMVKGKPWVPATLKEIGGTAGVGVALLEETFSSPTANPRHRLHQKAAQAVLTALLPEAGADIKGHMRRHDELLAASGYADRPREFDDLLRLLDSELRLITPTDPEGEPPDASSPPAPAGGQYYQLTHDYLVHSLRDWLTRKQKETRRGRAELLLADRAAVWNARPENRQLPSLPQWLQFRWLTQEKDWTPPQRKMMLRATRYHLARGLLWAAILVLLGLAGWQGYGRFQANHLRDRLLEANTADLPGILRDMTPYRRWVDPLLHEAYAQAERDHDSRKQLHASLALLSSDPGQAPYLYGRLLTADPQELGLIREKLAPHKDEFVPSLWAELADGKNPSRRFRAACALAEYAPGDPQWEEYCSFLVRSLVGENALHLGYWKELLEPIADRLLASLAAAVEDTRWGESQRRTITDLYRGFGEGRPGAFASLEARLNAEEERGGPEADRIDRAMRRANVAASLVELGRVEKVWPLLIHSEDPTLRSYLIERLGSARVDPHILQNRLETESNVSARRALVLALGGFSADQLPSLEPTLLDLYENNPDPGLHAAAGWLLRHWGRGDQLRPIEQRLATGRVIGRRRWFVNKQGHTYVLLPGSPLAMAATEVTVTQFRVFKVGHQIDEKAAPSADCPVNFIKWDDAAQYCNWLSDQDWIGKTEWCYVKKDGKWETAPDYERLAGYRLPTEKESTFASQAGARTRWFCGDVGPEIMGRYAWWYGNSGDSGTQHTYPVGTLKPNDFGLFDTLGNVSEWCQDLDRPAKVPNARAEPTGVMGVIQGGCYMSPFLSVGPGGRTRFHQGMSAAVIGFRPVRSVR